MLQIAKSYFILQFVNIYNAKTDNNFANCAQNTKYKKKFYKFFFFNQTIDFVMIVLLLFFL